MPTVTSETGNGNTTGRKDPSLVCVWPIGDSITYGVWAETLAGYREPLYNLAHPTTNLYLVGSQSFAGNAGGLAVDPWCDGYPGYCIRSGSAGGSLQDTMSGLAAKQVQGPIAAIVLAGTNDINQGDVTATVLASMSTFLDLIWSFRSGPKFQILLCQILKRLDGFDAEVQSVNAGIPSLVSGKSYTGNVIQVPMYAAVQRPVIGQGYHDAVHPDNEGYTDMANLLWPYVQQAIAAWDS